MKAEYEKQKLSASPAQKDLVGRYYTRLVCEEAAEKERRRLREKAGKGNR